MPLREQRLAFLGGGMMAAAMIRGILERQFRIRIYQLEKGTLRTVLSKAVHAAHERTRELGEAAERALAKRKL